MSAALLRSVAVEKTRAAYTAALAWLALAAWMTALAVRGLR